MKIYEVDRWSDEGSFSYHASKRAAEAQRKDNHGDEFEITEYEFKPTKTGIIELLNLITATHDN